MTNFRTKRTKAEIRQLTQLTRPPRLEGAVKEAMMQPVRKAKRARAQESASRKPQRRSEVARTLPA